MKKSLLILLFVVGGIGVSSAQRSYFEFKLSKEIFKDFELSISPQARFTEGFDLKKYFADLEAEYEFNKCFSAGASYRFGTNITKNDNKEFFGRFAVDLKLSNKWNNFEPKFRIRYSNENDDFSDLDEVSAIFLRYRPGIEYHIKKLNLNPYIYAEFFQEMPDNNWDKIRYETGMEYKINKHNRIQAYYRLNTDNNNAVSIIGLTYKLKL